jgi:hypothetical protein
LLFRERTQRKVPALASDSEGKAICTRKVVNFFARGKRQRSERHLNATICHTPFFPDSYNLQYNGWKDEEAEDDAAESDSFFSRQRRRNAD